MGAFIKIVERKGQLGLHLINREGDFFLFGKMLVTMWRNNGSYVLVKHHNADSKNAIAYHPGQIAGQIKQQQDKTSIYIYKGGVGKDVGLDDKNIPTNVVQHECYVLPTPDIEAVLAAFEVHYKNSSAFDELLLTGAAMVLTSG